MSYDIDFVRRQPGQDWEDALEATTDDPEPTTEERARLMAVLDRIEARADGVLGPWERYDAEEGSCVGELTDVERGVQVGLFTSMASVSFAYWEQEDREAFHEGIRQLVDIVAAETGLEAYDPQTGEAFDGTVEDEGGLQATRDIAAGHDAGSGSPAAGQTVPKGRNSTMLIVVGSLIAAVSLALIVAGEAGVLTWVALVIGIVDVVVGLRRRSG